MRIRKWHMLNRVVQSLWGGGDNEYIHTGVFENSHQNRKKCDRKTAPRHGTAIEELIERCEGTGAQKEHRHQIGLTSLTERTLKKR